MRLKTHVRRIRTDNGTDFVNQTLREYYDKVGISHETSVARSPQQNGVVKRRNRTLIEAARAMLIYVKASLFLWAEVVATACYTQNRSIIRLCHADIGIFIGYAPTNKAFRIYNRRTRRIIEIIHVDFDELTVMASEHSSSETVLHEMTPTTISSGLVPNYPPSTLFVPPSRTDWDLLFQPLFDELLTPSPSVDFPAPEVIALIAEVVAPEPAASTGSPSSTTIKQDAPSPSNSQTIPEKQTSVLSNDVEEDNHNLDVAHMNNDPFFGVEESQKTPTFCDDPLHESLHEDSTSLGSSLNMRQIHTPFKSLGRRTKDHPITNVIGDPSRSVSTRKQLQTNAIWCSGSDTLYTKSRERLITGKPSEKHLNSVKRIFRYLKGTINMGLWYSKDTGMFLTAYADADHAGCQDTRRSTSGSAQFLGDKLVSWSSKKQKCTAISSTEAEYIALFGYCA
nr:uncharacterized mitochondrial protein AtMg00810-like [Tanacetum cinerariifolium]